MSSRESWNPFSSAKSVLRARSRRTPFEEERESFMRVTGQSSACS
jgi:hypothetical protein